MIEPIDTAKKIVTTEEFRQLFEEAIEKMSHKATGICCIFMNDNTPYLQISYLGADKKDLVTALEAIKYDIISGVIK